MCIAKEAGFRYVLLITKHHDGFCLWDRNQPSYKDPDKKQYLHYGESYYMPFEHTICLSNRWNWFQKKELIPVRDREITGKPST